MKTFWPYYVTHLGAASLIVPLFLLSSCALISFRQTRSLCAWWVLLGLVTIIVLASKIVFIGWGLGIASLNFTGISGHAILASATYPFILAWLFARSTQKFNQLGFVVGLLLSLVIAWSRIAVGAHSLSEVLAGLILGWGVSIYACLQLKQQEKTMPLWFYPVFFVLVFGLLINHKTYLPTHQWEIKIALHFSGRDRPYTRGEMLATLNR